MIDPFKAQMSAERQRTAFWVLILAVFLATIAFLLSRAWDPRGLLIEAEVVRFGTRATEVGDMPVVTVRLADGSVRQVQTSGTLVRMCKQGDRISLVQRGTALSIGVRACQSGS